MGTGLADQAKLFTITIILSSGQRFMTDPDKVANKLDYDVAYLAEQFEDNKRFSRRFRVPFSQMFPSGCSVLDFGCGHGALSIEAAKTAASVVGIDLNSRLVTFANSYTRRQFPELGAKVDFREVDICTLPGTNLFDVIVSKDTLEHVAGLNLTLAALARLLKPNGRAYFGYSPLWFSPFGDHGVLTKYRLPWVHLFLGEQRFLSVHNAQNGRRDRTIKDAGFNGAAPEAFYSSIAAAGLSIISAIENASEGRKGILMPLFNPGKSIPALRKYCTVSLYLTLTK